MVQAMINSRRASYPLPGCAGFCLDATAFRPLELERLLYPQSCFAGDQRYRLLLRILGVHLHDRKICCADRERF